MRPTWLLLALLGLFGTGCYATPQLVAGPELLSLQTPRQRRPLLLRTVEGKQVRCDPNSYIRFHRPDGQASPWLRVDSLRVGPRGVWTGQPELRSEDGLPWAGIRLAEVTNLSGGRTFGSLMAHTAMTALLLPVVALGAGLTKGANFGSLSGSLSSSASASDLSIQDLPTEPANGAAASPVLGDGRLGAPGAEAAPLFSSGMRRQAIARFVLAGEAVTDLISRDGMNAGLSLVVRFWDLLEVGGGWRYLLTALPSSVGDQLYHSHIGLFRAGLHLDLDARRRFAIPLGVELGGGAAVRAQFRCNLGLRVRLVDRVFAGVYLFNPSYVGFRGGSAPARASGWSFLSGLELGAAF